MSKILGGAAIGFLVCSLLAFFVVTAIFASSDNADTRYLGFFAGLLSSALAGLVGAAIGASVGAFMEERNRPHRSRNWCKRCGSRLWDNSKTCKWCGAEVSWPSKE